MARHRRLLVPWWKRNPANTAIAATAVLTMGVTAPAAFLHSSPASQEAIADPATTVPLVYKPAPAPHIHEAAPEPVTPTNPPTDPISRPTLVLSVVTTGPNPTVPSRTLSFGEKLVYLASLQAGKPYRYGAAGPNAFDCSGLVYYVYAQLGHPIPRTTQAQFNASRHVDPSQREIGDLIFFGTPSNIYHVGIYAGDNQMWVARHSGEPVQLETIWTSHYLVGVI